MYKALTVIILALFISCGKENSTTENLFEIDASSVKTSYTWEDELKISISNKKNTPTDSIVAYWNDQRIEKLSGTIWKKALTDEKLGYHNIQLKVYYNDEVEILDSRIELVSNTAPTLLTYELVNTYPHDNKAYTQGLEFVQNQLYEGTGQLGSSSLRKVNFNSGVVENFMPLPANFFGEGITVLNQKIYQLTWMNQTALVYDLATMKEIKRFTYEKKMEGWGLTNDGTHLYMSDGTEKIYKLNSETFQIIDFVNVYTNGSKIKFINELEWINGKIFANVYQRDSIIIIHPKTGVVEAVINLGELKKQIDFSKLDVENDVLNGIAYHPIKKTLFVTGKNWDKMFEIKIKESGWLN